jgi:hypothetical protein
LAGLGISPNDGGADFHLSPPRIVPFALVAAVICGLSGIGVLPLPAAIVLDAGAATCYLVALRSGLPRWPKLPWAWLNWFSGLGPALLPLAGFASACVALAEKPGLVGLVLLPVWVLLLLSLCPWLEEGEELGASFRSGATVLAVLAISVPLPLFSLAMSPSVAAPVRGVTVAASVVVPTWRLVSLTRRSWRGAWQRAVLVAVLLGVAAGLSVLLRVPIPLLPVALLLGWYGLAGVVSQRSSRSISGFAVFVVLAGVLLAVAAPI